MSARSGPDFILLTLALALPSLARPAWAEVKLGALLKTYSLGIDSPGLPAQGVVTQRLRTSLRWDASSDSSGDWSTELTYDLVPTVGAQVSSIAQGLPVPQAKQYRAWDLSPTVYSGPDSLTVSQNLDRAALTWSRSDWTVVVGRQVVAFGSAKSVNPTDVFAPFSMATLDQEFRIGVDAVRARLATGELSGADFGVVAGKDLTAANSGAFARYRLLAAGTEATLSEMAFHGHLLTGLDLQRSIGGATARLEAAYVSRDASYLRLTSGAEYVLANGLDLFAEYHFNGAGTSNPSDYATLITEPAYSVGGVYLLSRHYLCLGAEYSFSPLWSLGTVDFIDVVGPSALAVVRADYSFSEESVLELGTFVTAGERGGATEFGLYPEVLYTAIKLYF